MNGRMRRCALLCMIVSLGAAADVVQVKEFTYVVKYTDDAVERYSVKWTLNVTTNVRDGAGVFIPYQGAVENRRCTWSITSSVDRTVSFVTRLGQAVPLANMSRTFKEDPRNPGREMVIAGERNETCNEARAQREKDVADARKAVLEMFDRLTTSDFEGLRKEAQANANVRTITVQ